MADITLDMFNEAIGQETPKKPPAPAFVPKKTKKKAEPQPSPIKIEEFQSERTQTVQDVQSIDLTPEQEKIGVFNGISVAVDEGNARVGLAWNSMMSFFRPVHKNTEDTVMSEVMFNTYMGDRQIQWKPGISFMQATYQRDKYDRDLRIERADVSVGAQISRVLVEGTMSLATPEGMAAVALSEVGGNLLLPVVSKFMPLATSLGGKIAVAAGKRAVSFSLPSSFLFTGAEAIHAAEAKQDFSVSDAASMFAAGLILDTGLHLAGKTIKAKRLPKDIQKLVNALDEAVKEENIAGIQKKTRQIQDLIKKNDRAQQLFTDALNTEQEVDTVLILRDLVRNKDIPTVDLEALAVAEEERRLRNLPIEERQARVLNSQQIVQEASIKRARAHLDETQITFDGVIMDETTPLKTTKPARDLNPLERTKLGWLAISGDKDAELMLNQYIYALDVSIGRDVAINFPNLLMEKELVKAQSVVEMYQAAVATGRVGKVVSIDGVPSLMLKEAPTPDIYPTYISVINKAGEIDSFPLLGDTVSKVLLVINNNSSKVGKEKAIQWVSYRTGLTRQEVIDLSNTVSIKLNKVLKDGGVSRTDEVLVNTWDFRNYTNSVRQSVINMEREGISIGSFAKKVVPDNTVTPVRPEIIEIPTRISEGSDLRTIDPVIGNAFKDLTDSWNRNNSLKDTAAKWVDVLESDGKKPTATIDIQTGRQINQERIDINELSKAVDEYRDKVSNLIRESASKEKINLTDIFKQVDEVFFKLTNCINGGK